MEDKKVEYRQLIKRLYKKIAEIKNPKWKKQSRDILDELNNSIHGVYIKAITDQKTGLYNNYFFETVLDRELERARRLNHPVCLFILDIDHFKKINDTHGHIKADEMLKRLSTIVMKNTRSFDTVARFGGEEFIILFPETSLRKAKQITNRIRLAIKEDIFLKQYGLTISGGLTKFHEEDNSQSIKIRADQGLNKAKNSGRDKFIVMK